MHLRSAVKRIIAATVGAALVAGLVVCLCGDDDFKIHINHADQKRAAPVQRTVVVGKPLPANHHKSSATSKSGKLERKTKRTLKSPFREKPDNKSQGAKGSKGFHAECIPIDATPAPSGTGTPGSKKDKNDIKTTLFMVMGRRKVVSKSSREGLVRQLMKPKPKDDIFSDDFHVELTEKSADDRRDLPLEATIPPVKEDTSKSKGKGGSSGSTKDGTMPKGSSFNSAKESSKSKKKGSTSTPVSPR